MNSLSRYVVILVLLLTATVVRADPSADAVTNLFVKVCVPNAGSPEQVRAWAAEKHLPEITNPDGRKIYVGEGPNGIAWWLHGETTYLVLSIRGTGACAVYAANADPSAMLNYFEMIVARLSTQGTEVTHPPDRNEPGPNGMRVGKLRIFVSPDKRKIMVLTLITNERPGGPYQGTLQITMGPNS